jgi:predicted nucleotidyltransferase
MSLQNSINDVSEIKKIVAESSGKLLNVCVSGSHLYGFESVDSDIDYRGTWLIDTNKLLGIHTPKDHITRDIGINDIVLFELKKEMNLLYKGNCNVLEHIFSKQLYTSDEYFELKKLVGLNLNMNGLYQSYRGMAWENYNKFCRAGKHTVKKFLYVFRAQLAGIHVLNTREIKPNINELLETPYAFDTSLIKQLVKLKRNGHEKDLLEDSIGSQCHSLVTALFTEMDAIYEKVKPSERLERDLASQREKYFDKFLKKCRRNYMKNLDRESRN